MRFLLSLTRIVIAVLIISTALVTSYFIYENYFTVAAKDAKIRRLFEKLKTETGQTQDDVFLIIDENSQLNAYTDGTKVVLFRGMINFVANTDELALILSHELAHVALRHVVFPQFANESLATEANADKMGAVYMMKAGYNICIAREFWKRMRDGYGNSQGGSHPDYSYRYDELNIGCS